MKMRSGPLAGSILRGPFWAFLALLVTLLWPGGGRGAEPGEDIPFRVPAGFSVERVAGPPQVEYPLFASFDDRGRLYVVDPAGVNLSPEELTKNPPNRIRLLEDTHGDGHFDKGTLFADKLTYPQGILWHDGAVYVASPPSLWRFDEIRSDGKGQARTELVTGFTFTKWADDLHGPVLGPDGRLYWTSGRYAHDIHRPGGKSVRKGFGPLILRARPDGEEIETFASGIGNPVELAFTSEGEGITAGTFALNDGGRDAVVHCVEGGVYPIKDVDLARLTDFKRTGDPLPVLVPLGVVAPSGILRYQSGVFGAEYRDNLFLALFGARTVQRYVLERDGATFRARNEEFITGTSQDFHPTDVLEDADGSLLVIDTGNWYNLCPSAQVGKSPVKGGIYRIRRRSSPQVADARGLAIKWNSLRPEDLALLLDDPRFAVRDRAIAALAKRGGQAGTVLRQTVQSGVSAEARRNAIWTLCRIDGSAARATVRLALADKDASVRQSAVYAAGLHRDPEALGRLLEMVRTDSPPIRREAATALGRLRSPKAVPALLESARLAGDRFLHHALINALITIGDVESVRKGLRDPSPSARRAGLLALDQMEAGNLDRELVASQLDGQDPALEETALRIMSAHPAWSKEILKMLPQWLAQGSLDESRRRTLRGVLIGFSEDPQIQTLVAQVLRDEKSPVATRALVLETMQVMPRKKLPASWLAELRACVKSRQARIVLQAVASMRALDASDFDSELESVARDETRTPDLRVEALAALAGRMNAVDDVLFQFLARCLDREKPPLLRRTAAEALGRAPLSNLQLVALADTLTHVGALEAPRLIFAFSRSEGEEVGRALVTALEKSPGAESLTPEILKETLARYSPGVRKSAESLMSRLQAGREKEEARLAELEPLIKEGDAARGRPVFSGNKAGCMVCHAIEGQGGRVGPDLSKIGASRTRRDLLEAIIFPSASFARGYEPYTIKTRDGSVQNGIIARETADSLYLIDAERVERRIERALIEEIRQSRVSIMPQGLDAQLSRQDLADLIAFLQSLK